MPKHARPCNVVAWNPVDKHLILSGLDKHSKDHSVLLWDIDKNPQCSERMHHHGTNQMDCIRPIAELGVSETIHSAAWFKHDPKCLVLGANNKQLKMLDFRGMLMKDKKLYDQLFIFMIRFCPLIRFN